MWMVAAFTGGLIALFDWLEYIAQNVSVRIGNGGWKLTRA